MGSGGRTGFGLGPTLAGEAAAAGAGTPEAPLGRYRLERELGRGGMGRVLEALDPELSRRVAVKILLAPEEGGDLQTRRFAAEARVTAQLEHPGIVPVYDAGVAPDGQLYFVMRKVQGRTLRDAIGALGAGDAAARARFTRFRLLGAFVQVCQAVGYAHGRGVLHRDIKPENVMMGEHGEVLVLDWGIARVTGDPAPE